MQMQHKSERSERHRKGLFPVFPPDFQFWIDHLDGFPIWKKSYHSSCLIIALKILKAVGALDGAALSLTLLALVLFVSSPCV